MDVLERIKAAAESREPENPGNRKGGRPPGPSQLPIRSAPITPRDAAQRPWLAAAGGQAVEPVNAYEQVRDESGRFLPGQSGNPGGRPADVIRLIASLTGNGEELIMHALRVMRAEITCTVMTAKGEAVEVGPSTKDQNSARDFLADRLWGRAPATLDVHVKKTEEKTITMRLEGLSPDELAAYVQIQSKLLGASTVDGEIVSEADSAAVADAPGLADGREAAEPA